MEQAWRAAATRAQILASEKQMTDDGAEILTLTHHNDAPVAPGGAGEGQAGGEEFDGRPGGAVAYRYEDLRFDFVHAAQTGDANQLRIVLELKIDVNVQDDDGYPALTLASCYGHEEAVAVLLEAPDIDFDTMAHDGCTALQVAAQDGFERVVRLLVQAKADLDLAHKGAAGPMFLAAQEGHVGIVEVLAESRADVNRTRQEYTPLFIAAQEVSEREVTGVPSGCYRHHHDHRHRNHHHRHHQLHCHHNNNNKQGHTEVVSVLVAFRADLDLQAANGSTPLYIACQKGRLDAVQCLVASAHPASPHAHPTPLCLCLCGSAAGAAACACCCCCSCRRRPPPLLLLLLRCVQNAVVQGDFFQFGGLLNCCRCGVCCCAASASSAAPCWCSSAIAVAADAANVNLAKEDSYVVSRESRVSGPVVPSVQWRRLVQ
jgi:ankyrin repeat protein